MVLQSVQATDRATTFRGDILITSSPVLWQGNAAKW